MNPRTEQHLPIPNCWHDSWHDLAKKHGFDEFPTKEYLAKHPSLSGPFCAWVWKRLASTRGRMCKWPVTEECRNCQRMGTSKIIAIRILSLIVKDEDPTLYFYLDHKFIKMKNAYPYVRKGKRPYTPPDPPLDNPPEPYPPIAVNMPRPMPHITTYLVARELRNKPWLRDWLEQPRT